MKNSHAGFAALLLVITLSTAIMAMMIAVSDSMWLLRRNVQSLGDRTQSQLAAESCRQLALLYVAEDPEYQSLTRIDFGRDISCEIISIADVSAGFNILDKKIITKGSYRDVSSVLESSVHITNAGLIEGYRYYK